MTHPEARKWFHDLFHTITDEWGYDFLKTDFVEWTILAPLGVLTAPSARRQGWATRAAAVATNEALDRGLIPQWRARTGNTASLALAEKLGYLPLGRQTTVLLS